MDEEVKIVLKTFKSILKLKLIEKYHEKFDECIKDLCDLIINKLNTCTGNIDTLLKLNVQALRSSLEFKYKSKSRLYGLKMIKINNNDLNLVKNSVDAHLVFFDIEIQEDTDRIKQLRYNYIIKQDCEGLINICNSNWVNQVTQLKNHFIKHNCAALYEIISTRMMFKKPHPRIDILMRHHTNALAHVLKMKIDTMDYQEHAEKENKILTMHSRLLDELNIYLDKSLD